MRYTLMLHSDESAFSKLSEEQRGQQKAAFGRYIGMLKQASVFVDTDWLQPSSTATTLSLRGGTKRVQDGPFANTKEQVGGYFVLNVNNLDEALMWAEKCPAAQYGTIEIRATALG